MPNLSVEFKCEQCGTVLRYWGQQTISSILRNAHDLADDYGAHPSRHPDYLICRKCQKTIVYDDVICVEHDQSQGEYSDVIFATSKNGHSYFAIGADTMDAICDAWQKYRGDDNG